MGAAARLECLRSPDALEAAAPPERRAAVAAVVEALGADWVATSEPWMAGEPAGVCRNTAAIHAMVSDADVAVLFAALRTAGTPGFPAAVRLALRLPV